MSAAAVAAAVLALAGWRLRESTAEPAGEPAGLTVEWIAAPAPVQAGEEASFIVAAAPGSLCTPRLELRSGTSRAAGLASQAAGADGAVRWSWQVSSATSPGRWPLTVTCIAGGRQAALETVLDVRPPR